MSVESRGPGSAAISGARGVSSFSRGAIESGVSRGGQSMRTSISRSGEIKNAGFQSPATRSGPKSEGFRSFLTSHPKMEATKGVSLDTHLPHIFKGEMRSLYERPKQKTNPANPFRNTAELKVRNQADNNVQSKELLKTTKPLYQRKEHERQAPKNPFQNTIELKAVQQTERNNQPESSLKATKALWERPRIQVKEQQQSDVSFIPEAAAEKRAHKAQASHGNGQPSHPNLEWKKQQADYVQKKTQALPQNRSVRTSNIEQKSQTAFQGKLQEMARKRTGAARLSHQDQEARTTSVIQSRKLMPKTPEELINKARAVRKDQNVAVLENRVKSLRSAYEKQYGKILQPLATVSSQVKQEIQPPVQIQTKTQERFEQAAAVLAGQEKQTDTTTQKQLLQVVHQSLQKETETTKQPTVVQEQQSEQVQEVNELMLHTKAQKARRVEVIEEFEQIVGDKRMKVRKLIDPQQGEIIEREEIVPERDMVADANRVATAVDVGTKALEEARKYGKDQISSAEVARRMPKSPGQRLMSYIRKQLKLSDSSEEQYDQFRDVLAGSSSQLSSAYEIQKAAQDATDRAPAVRLTKQITTEVVNPIDEVRAVSDSKVLFAKASHVA